MNAGLVAQAIRRHIDPFAQTLIPECPIRASAGMKPMTWNGEVLKDMMGVRMYEHWVDYRADFITISVAGYATEIEVKVSRSDWKCDLVKEKWGAIPPWVTRFIYCVPEELGIPDWVPEFAGVWHLKKSKRRKIDPDTGRYSSEFEDSGYEIHVIRAPKKLGNTKVPKDVTEKWMKNFYYRYWNQRSTLDQRIPLAKPVEVTT